MCGEGEGEGGGGGGKRKEEGEGEGEGEGVRKRGSYMVLLISHPSQHKPPYMVLYTAMPLEATLATNHAILEPLGKRVYF